VQILANFFGIKDLIPHGFCLSWSPTLLWLHVISDAVITLSYYFIPLIVVMFLKRRQDIPYSSLFFLSCAFIVACGTTHLLSIVTIWIPLYWLDGVIKTLTAIISLITAIVLLRVVPEALQLPSTVKQLRAEIQERKKAQRSENRALRSLQESEERLRLVLEGADLGFWDWNIVTGEVKRNEIWAKMLGYSYQEIENSKLQWIDFIHPEDREKAWQSICDTLEGRLPAHKIEYRMLHKDGSIRWILDHANVMQRDADGKPTRMSGTHLDITERKLTEIKLRIGSTIFESQEGMFVTDADSVILQANDSLTKITGYTAEEVINKTPRIFSSGRHDQSFYKQLWQAIIETGAWQGEIWNRRKNGEIYPQWLTITAVKNDNDHCVSHYVATLIDITDRKNNEERIHHLAFHDPLTNLPNRYLLHERLDHYIKLERRNGEQTAVLMLDLDKFKAVNDTFGHLAGDELLQQVAKRISQRLRSSDMVARLGGDEFVLLIHNINQPQFVEKIAEDIIAELSRPFTLSQGNTVEIGASIGISIHPKQGDSPEILIKNADAALYRAKNNGRGCFALYSD
jgi:diguanylate cyclase (GGDEF)-like protein/PAS domain S-box-containing protein